MYAQIDCASENRSFICVPALGVGLPFAKGLTDLRVSSVVDELTNSKS